MKINLGCFHRYKLSVAPCWSTREHKVRFYSEVSLTICVVLVQQKLLTFEMISETAAFVELILLIQCTSFRVIPQNPGVVVSFQIPNEW